MKTFKDVEDALRVMGEIYGKTISPSAAMMIAQDLAEFSPDDILSALASCRKELKFFPTIADLVSRIQAKDGRPGSEDAWSMIPKDEFGSCVWTVEMATAYGAAHPHVRLGDHVAARMAFKEVYEREVKAARETRVPATWNATLGYVSSTHSGVLMEAVRKNRITLEHAAKLTPAFEPIRVVKELPAPAEPATTPEDARARIQALIAQIAKPMPGGEP